MGKTICVCGASGGIGQPLSLLLKQGLPGGSKLSLYDIVNVKGVYADLSHINTDVVLSVHQGADELDAALKGADVVVIPAGVPRKPGMTRDDLFNVNAGIVRDLITAVARNCPKAFVCIITNPVNSTVPIAAEVLKKAGVYNENFLLGVTTLDLVRASTFCGEKVGVSTETCKIPVIGGHSGVTILPVLSQATKRDGSPLFSNLDVETQKALTLKIQNAGTEVVDAKAGAGSATLSMAFAGARLTFAVVNGLEGKVVEEYAFVSSPNRSTPFFALKVELGPNGIQKRHDIGQLNGFESEQLSIVEKELKKNIETGLTFTASL